MAPSAYSARATARQLVYADKRAKAGGKVPDDVWSLRPQDADAAGLFGAAGDTWHVPRVAGTFRKRNGHVCRMSVAVLERIVRMSSNAGALVVDPLCGPGTTLVAAKRLGRRWLGIELCEGTAELTGKRLEQELPPLPGGCGMICPSPSRLGPLAAPATSRQPGAVCGPDVRPHKA